MRWLVGAVVGLVACGGATSQEPASSDEVASGMSGVSGVVADSGGSKARSGATDAASKSGASGATGVTGATGSASGTSGGATGSRSGSSGVRPADAGHDTRPAASDASSDRSEPPRDVRPAETAVQDSGDSRRVADLYVSAVTAGEGDATLLGRWSPGWTTGVYAHVRLNFSRVSACGMGVRYAVNATTDREVGPDPTTIPRSGPWSFEIPLSAPFDVMKQTITVYIPDLSIYGCLTEIASVEFWN